ncbi:hypothetical protein BJ742DRAFT_855453 [Cladochytrium replicatum]|nr:hypothetical protein BJ742DRAFT_855453 [Cladochytrium replicatum]
MGEPQPVPFLQVAGHADQLVAFADGSIVKASTNREASFYETAQLPQHSSIRSWIPVFYGVESSGSSPDYILPPRVRIQNLLTSFRNPCVADIKLGTRLYDDHALPEKREKMMRQALQYTSHATGMRICGVKVYVPGERRYVEYSRKWGRSLTVADLNHAVKSIFTIPDPSTPAVIDDPQFVPTGRMVGTSFIRSVLAQLEQIIESLEKTAARFYACSVLIIYEGEITLGDNASPVVRIIDFAHSHFLDENESGPDEGAIKGLRSLCRLIREHVLQEM